jgi:hypothetical protein
MPAQKTRTQQPVACTNQEPKQSAGEMKIWGSSSYAHANILPREKERQGELQLWRKQQTATGPTNKQRDQNRCGQDPDLGGGGGNRRKTEQN